MPSELPTLNLMQTYNFFLPGFTSQISSYYLLQVFQQEKQQDDG